VVRGRLGLFVQMQGVITRERDRLRTEIMRVPGLMLLLMKQRNGEPWTWEDVTELRMYLRGVSAIIPYVFMVVLPGSYVLLPLLAWWLDRRQQQRLVKADRNERMEGCSQRGSGYLFSC
jgi:hypothetical protein